MYVLIFFFINLNVNTFYALHYFINSQWIIKQLHEKKNVVMWFILN